MRVAYINKSDSAALVSDSTAGTLVVSNLQNIYKSKVWRASGTSASITCTWTTGKLVSIVSMPFCSLSSSATARIQAFTNAGDSVAVYDSGFVVAIPPVALTSWPWGSVPLGVNAYSYGIYSTLVKYIPLGSYEKIIISLDDPLNTLGYIEAGRLFISDYYEFNINAEYGASSGNIDTSTQYRNDASDLLTDRGIVAKTLSLSLAYMDKQDREQFSSIVKSASISSPVFVSVFPESTDKLLEQEYQIFGKMTKTSAITIENVNRYGSSLELESV